MESTSTHRPGNPTASSGLRRVTIVLDTNVVSELMRSAPAPAVLAWLRQTSSTGLHTTAVTVAEIRYGIARLPDGRRKHDLHQAANEIFAAFPRQVLPFDLAAATAYAEVVARREADGNPIDGFDGQIAAICRAQVATLASRNTKDFVNTGISLIDPWQEMTV
ncbi:type II toxin-antitoxin system VapC family toxin [Paractinoplanes brasiliensis]|uniref:Ribonuclease VapC n=1 Tax=Paractinoplanes brasiliensis TaxID=52695 RepID=A0A4R6J6I3_9ACTN|nr:type II toxin-antitoxin system VapC family toxin [Actinoplanes brasiliensis]TDO31079.1 hypothetical protein C8E87_6489 [Actinoplanes brasiliensis]